METTGFEIFQFPPLVSAGLQAVGFTAPTPLQAQAIPMIMQGKDIIALAPPGAGKTTSMVISVLQRLSSGQRGTARALVLTPTPETADRTCLLVDRLGKKTGLLYAAIYGESIVNYQIKQLQTKPEIIVGCPNRILDCLWKNKLNLADLEILAIDEADHMFGQGFWPDIFNILACITHKRKTMVFSATMPENLRKLSSQFLHAPVTVTGEEQAKVKTLPQPVKALPQPAKLLSTNKTALLTALLNKFKSDAVLVFTRTRPSAVRIAQDVAKVGYQVIALKGNLVNYQKSAAFKGLPAGAVIILAVAGTAMQGVNVSTIFRLVNDKKAKTGEKTQHVGLTGRLDKNGDTLTLVTAANALNIRALEQLLESPLEQFPL